MTLCVERRLIDELAVLAADGDLSVVAGLAVSDDLCVNFETAAYVDDSLCGGLVGVELHTVAHIEDGVHLFPVGAALFVDEAEQRRGGEEVVLDHVQLVDEVQHLGLGTAAAVYHTVDFWAGFVKYAANDGSVGAGGREDHLAGIDASHFCGVCQTFAAAIYHFVGQTIVETFRELLGIVFSEDVVACRG